MFLPRKLPVLSQNSFDFIKTKYPEIPSGIAQEKVISDTTEEKLKKAIEEFKAEFLK